VDTLIVSRESAVDSAEVLYKQAEEAYLLGEYEKAVTLYESVFNQFSKSPYAAKALYTFGWINENFLNNNQAAIDAYYELLKNYRNSEYAAAIKVKIDTVNAYLEGEKRLEILEITNYYAYLSRISLDTVYMNYIIQSFTNPDSDFVVSLVRDSLLSAEAKVIENRVLIIPDSLKNIPINGFIDINLLIDTNREVGDWFFFRNTTDNTAIEDAVEIAALKSKYSFALDKKNKPIDTWIIRRYIFPRK